MGSCVHGHPLELQCQPMYNQGGSTQGFSTPGASPMQCGQSISPSIGFVNTSNVPNHQNANMVSPSTIMEPNQMGTNSSCTIGNSYPGQYGPHYIQSPSSISMSGVNLPPSIGFVGAPNAMVVSNQNTNLASMTTGGVEAHVGGNAARLDNQHHVQNLATMQPPLNTMQMPGFSTPAAVNAQPLMIHPQPAQSVGSADARNVMMTPANQNANLAAIATTSVEAHLGGIAGRVDVQFSGVNLAMPPHLQPSLNSIPMPGIAMPSVNSPSPTIVQTASMGAGESKNVMVATNPNATSTTAASIVNAHTTSPIAPTSISQSQLNPFAETEKAYEASQESQDAPKIVTSNQESQTHSNDVYDVARLERERAEKYHDIIMKVLLPVVNEQVQQQVALQMRDVGRSVGEGVGEGVVPVGSLDLGRVVGLEVSSSKNLGDAVGEVEKPVKPDSSTASNVDTTDARNLIGGVSFAENQTQAHHTHTNEVSAAKLSEPEQQQSADPPSNNDLLDTTPKLAVAASDDMKSHDASMDQSSADSDQDEDVDATETRGGKSISSNDEGLKASASRNKRKRSPSAPIDLPGASSRKIRRAASEDLSTPSTGADVNNSRASTLSPISTRTRKALKTKTVASPKAASPKAASAEDDDSSTSESSSESSCSPYPTKKKLRTRRNSMPDVSTKEKAVRGRAASNLTGQSSQSAESETLRSKKKGGGPRIQPSVDDSGPADNPQADGLFLSRSTREHQARRAPQEDASVRSAKTTKNVVSTSRQPQSALRAPSFTSPNTRARTARTPSAPSTSVVNLKRTVPPITSTSQAKSHRKSAEPLQTPLPPSGPSSSVFATGASSPLFSPASDIIVPPGMSLAKKRVLKFMEESPSSNEQGNVSTISVPQTGSAELKSETDDDVEITGVFKLSEKRVSESHVELEEVDLTIDDLESSPVKNEMETDIASSAETLSKNDLALTVTDQRITDNAAKIPIEPDQTMSTDLEMAVLDRQELPNRNMDLASTRQASNDDLRMTDEASHDPVDHNMTWSPAKEKPSDEIASLVKQESVVSTGENMISSSAKQEPSDRIVSSSKKESVESIDENASNIYDAYRLREQSFAASSKIMADPARGSSASYASEQTEQPSIIGSGMVHIEQERATGDTSSSTDSMDIMEVVDEISCAGQQEPSVNDLGMGTSTDHYQERLVVDTAQQSTNESTMVGTLNVQEATGNENVPALSEEPAMNVLEGVVADVDHGPSSTDYAAQSIEQPLTSDLEMSGEASNTGQEPSIDNPSLDNLVSSSIESYSMNNLNLTASAGQDPSDAVSLPSLEPPSMNGVPTVQTPPDNYASPLRAQNSVHDSRTIAIGPVHDAIPQSTEQRVVNRAEMTPSINGPNIASRPIGTLSRASTPHHMQILSLQSSNESSRLSQPTEMTLHACVFLPPHESVYAFAITSPIRYSFVASEGKIKIFDIERGAVGPNKLVPEVLRFEMKSDKPFVVKAMRMSPNGTTLLVGGESRYIYILDISVPSPTTLGKLTLPEGVHTYCISMFKDGDRTITGGSENIVRLWSLSARTVMKSFSGHSGPVTCCELSSNNLYLFTGSLDSTFRVWSIESGSQLAVYDVQEPIVSIAVDARSYRFIVGTEKSLKCINTRREHDNREVSTFGSGPVEIVNIVPPDASSFDVAWNAIGFCRKFKWFAAGSSSGKVVLFDASSLDIFHTFDENIGSLSVQESHCGKYLVIGHKRGSVGSDHPSLNVYKF
ncbi:hypothetical protein HDU76_012704, partial [Blyttiomyces sp. JEL0837]